MQWPPEFKPTLSWPRVVEDRLAVVEDPLLPAVHSKGSKDFGSMTHDQARNTFRRVYNVTAKWKPKPFHLLRSSAGNEVISWMSNLLISFSENDPDAAYALNAAMVIPALLLQRSSQNLKNHLCIQNLKRKVDLWNEVHIHLLLREGIAIQKRLEVGKEDPRKPTTIRLPVPWKAGTLKPPSLSWHKPVVKDVYPWMR